MTKTDKIIFPRHRPDGEIEKAFMKAKLERLKELPFECETAFEVGVEFSCLNHEFGGADLIKKHRCDFDKESQKHLCDSKEAAFILGIHLATVSAMLSDNGIKRVPTARKIMWERSGVENLAFIRKERKAGLTR